MLSARTYTLMPYLLSFFCMYCLNVHIPLNPWSDSSTVQSVPGVWFASQATTNLSYMLRIGANFSSAFRWALVVESSKRKQYKRNKNFFDSSLLCNWLARTIICPNPCSTSFGALCSAQEQQGSLRVREFLSRLYFTEIQVCLYNWFSHSQSSG